MVVRRDTRGPSQRQLRVGEELRHALSALLRKGDFRDPALHDLNVTVNEVRISPDLKNATAFVIPLGGKGTDEAVKALNRAAPFMRSQLARAVRLQYVPQLSFEADRSMDEVSRIDSLLRRPEVQKDLRNTPAPEEGEED
ncbi:MAG: 30S ribosome-binding factor RbfA [Pseudomonadota bacterium]|nr:30S ribosome-binding factor RbfA [Pseudomonadota bacterium]